MNGLSLVGLFVLLGASSLSSVAFSAEDCEANFSRSELWLQSFHHFHCTSQGWSVSRRVGDTHTQCAALHPNGQLIVVVDENGSESALLRNLEYDRWLTSADQFAEVRVNIDGSVRRQGLSQVEVGASPPLRWGFFWPIEDADTQALRRGNALKVEIGDGSWEIGLRGSSAAIGAAQACSTWKQGQKIALPSSGSPSGGIASRILGCCLAIRRASTLAGVPTSNQGQCPPLSSIQLDPPSWEYLCEMWAGIQAGTILLRLP
jgi:hypothetical protein